MPEDEPVIDLIYKYFSMYVSGEGGINSHGIMSSFDLEGIDNRVRGIYTTKLLIFINEVVNQQHKNTDTMKPKKRQKNNGKKY